MLISPAFAQTASAGPSFFDPQLLMLVLVFAVFYFIVFRPQQQKAKRHRAMLAALRRGDRVLTGGGIIGTIAKVVDDHDILVDIAPNTRVKVARQTIAEVLAKPEPAKGDKDKAADKTADKDAEDEEVQATADAPKKGA